MKKLIVLLLVACMMLTTAAMGEQIAVLQDEQPPKVVTYKDENGDVIAATIYDAQGEELASVKDDGSLVLTDAHFRGEGDPVVSARLSAAYEGVMYGVHFSDVACMAHEHEIKADITEQKVYDLVMYELFDVMTYGDAATLLTEGCSIGVTLEQDVNRSLPVAIMFTPDGEKWELLDYTVAGDNRFNVLLPQAGTLALLTDGREAMGIGSGAASGETASPADGSSSSEGGNFTPSVSGKPAPEVVTTEGSNGESLAGYIRNTAGDVEIAVPDENYIVVTSVAESDFVVDIQTHEHLEWGYDSILEAEDVGELLTETGVLADDLDAALTEMGLSLTHDQLVVKDLFEVTAYGDYVEYLYNDDYYLEVTFDTDLDTSKPLVVIHSHDSVHWHIHSADELALGADGQVTLKMYDLGAVAFLVEAEQTVDAETAVQSPN